MLLTRGRPRLQPVGAGGPASIQSLYSWWVACITLVIASISFGAVTSIPVLLKPLASDWQAGASTIALVHTSAMVGAGVGSLLLGRLLDRFGFFGISLLAAAATGGGLVLAASASNLLTLHFAYGVLVGGIGQGAFFSPLAAAVSQWFDRHRALAIALAACGQSVGGLALPPVLRWSAEAYGWRQTIESYGIAAGLVLCACAFAFRRAPPRLSAPGPAHGATANRTLDRKGFALLGSSMALSNLAAFIAIGHLTAFGEEKGFAPAAAAAFVSVMLGATLLLRLSIGPLTIRFGHFRTLVAVSLVHLAGVVLLALADSQASIILSVLLIGIGFGGYVPAYAVLVRELFPAAQAGRRLAEIYFFAFLAAGGGSWVGGITRDASGSYALPFAVAAVCAATGVLLLLSLSGRFRQA
ncbi:MFS transporter [Ramlibacter sp.]|uniref:MFS transporter n=1 Tax=Ramlibacter sp. TaxID=1917967 RepID=UPI002FC78F3E